MNKDEIIKKLEEFQQLLFYGKNIIYHKQEVL